MLRTMGKLHACTSCCPYPRTAGYLRLWDTPDDPWSTTTSSSTVLDELTSYWNANMASQQRTVVYMARCEAGGCLLGWLAG